MLNMLLLTLKLSFAGAPSACNAAKEAGMTSCPTQLRVHGENSTVSLSNGRYQLKVFGF